MKHIYIIKTGSTFHTTRTQYNDFEHWIIDQLEMSRSKLFTVNVQAGDALPDINVCDGVIITGSHAMVTEEALWSQNTERWLVEAVHRDIPLLAICYGHQLLAKALGGTSGYHPHGMEMGTVDINVSDNTQDDLLFGDLPKRFLGHTIHSQTVITLPEGAIRLAFNVHDQNHAFRIGKYAWGVQFHPEFNKAIMNSYIEEVSRSKMFDQERTALLLEKTQETVEANTLLKKFEKIVCER